MQKLKEQKGITLIALIITIIVMLILVGVSVTVALNGGLFSTANTAKSGTQIELEKERLLSIVLGTLDDKGIMDPVELEKALDKTEFTYNDDDGTITSEKTGKTYVVGERGSVTLPSEGGSGTGVTLTWTHTDEDNDGIFDVGEVVTASNEESFYVIGQDGDTLILLAKYNLNEAGTAQDTEGNINPCPFSTTPYWTGADDDLSDNDNVDGAMAIAKAYGLTVSGTEGRLMTLEEVEALGGSSESYSTSTCNTNGNKFVNSPVDGTTLDYWLGSAGHADCVWFVYGSVSDLSYDDFSYVYRCGVRPVVVISESAVTIVP